VATFAELISDCTDAIRVASATEQAGRALNAAYREVCSRLRLLQAQTTITITEQKTLYTWAELGLDDFVALIDMSRILTGTTDVMRPTRQVAEQEITLSNAAMPMVVSETLISTIGAASVALWPAPAVGEKIPITYVQRPQEMTTDDDTPDALPEEFHDMLVDGALARLWRMERGPEAKREQRQCRADFEAGIGRLRAHLSTLGGQTPQRVRVGYPGIIRTLVDNDVYLSGRRP
jgi:hypothetical protein